jgi:hypothetical protein
VIDGIQIPIIVVKTDDFREIYSAMNYSKRKIPARILRYCKEQLYEIVKSKDPDKKISVVSIDEIENKSDVEFLVGVGVMGNAATGGNNSIFSNISEVGYAAFDAKELIEDAIYQSKNFDSKMILEQTIRNAGRTTKYVPVFKYLSETGITTLDSYKTSGLQLDKWVCKTPRDFRLGAYAKPFLRNHKAKNSTEIIATCTPENAAIYIPFLKKENIDIDLLEKFLKENYSKMDYSASNYASYYRKLVCLYDLYKWGW